MTYSANLLGLEKSAFDWTNLSALRKGIILDAYRDAHWHNFKSRDDSKIIDIGKLVNSIEGNYDSDSIENIIQQQRKSYLAANKNNTDDTFVKELAERFMDGRFYDDLKAHAYGKFNLQPRHTGFRAIDDEPGSSYDEAPEWHRSREKDPNVLRYKLHSQLNIPIDSKSEANIPYLDKLKAHRYMQVLPGIGRSLLAAPIASLLGGSGIGAGLGGVAGTYLGSYLADVTGNHLYGDMKSAGNIGSLVGSVGGAIGGRMLLNSFKGKKKKKRDE